MCINKININYLRRRYSEIDKVDRLLLHYLLQVHYYSRYLYVYKYTYRYISIHIYIYIYIYVIKKMCIYTSYTALLPS